MCNYYNSDDGIYHLIEDINIPNLRLQEDILFIESCDKLNLLQESKLGDIIKKIKEWIKNIITKIKTFIKTKFSKKEELFQYEGMTFQDKVTLKVINFNYSDSDNKIFKIVQKYSYYAVSMFRANNILDSIDNENALTDNTNIEYIESNLDKLQNQVKDRQQSYKSDIEKMNKILYIGGVRQEKEMTFTKDEIVKFTINKKLDNIAGITEGMDAGEKQFNKILDSISAIQKKYSNDELKQSYLERLLNMIQEYFTISTNTYIAYFKAMDEKNQEERKILEKAVR